MPNTSTIQVGHFFYVRLLYHYKILLKIDKEHNKALVQHLFATYGSEEGVRAAVKTVNSISTLF